MGGVVCGGHCRINSLRVVLFNVFFSFFSTRVAVGCLAIGLLTESFTVTRFGQGEKVESPGDRYI